MRRTWLSFRAGIAALDCLKVGLGPERVGRLVGLWVRTHWRVWVGRAMVGYLDSVFLDEGGLEGWRRGEVKMEGSCAEHFLICD